MEWIKESLESDHLLSHVSLLITPPPPYCADVVGRRMHPASSAPLGRSCLSGMHAPPNDQTHSDFIQNDFTKIFLSLLLNTFADCSRRLFNAHRLGVVIALNIITAELFKLFKHL